MVMLIVHNSLNCQKMVLVTLLYTYSSLIWFLDIGKVSLYPSWPPPILWTIKKNKNWGFGNLIGASEKSKN